MRVLWIVLLAACGGQSPATVTNAAPPEPESGVGLQLRVVRDHEVWLEREAGLDTNDPCCGLSYDARKYDDALATCATVDDDCGTDRDAVYPGLADDPVCGERRRCVPLPSVRVVTEDATEVTLDDEVGRDGFVTVTIGGKTQLVAVDYGARYTIVVRGGAVERVTRDL